MLAVCRDNALMLHRLMIFYIYFNNKSKFYTLFQSPLCRVKIKIFKDYPRWQKVSIPFMSGQNSTGLPLSEVGIRFQSPLCRVKMITEFILSTFSALFQSPLCRVKIYVTVQSGDFLKRFQSPLCRVKMGFNLFHKGGGQMFQSPLCRVKIVALF